MSRRTELALTLLVTFPIGFTSVLIYTEAADRAAVVQQEGE